MTNIQFERIEVAADRLERVSTCLLACIRAGHIVGADADAARRHSDDLNRYLSGEFDLEIALGLKVRGERTPETRAGLEQRDHHIREVATRFFAGASVAEQARQICMEMNRYQAGSWLVEGALDECPARHRRRMQGLFWLALKARPIVPGDRWLREILSKFTPVDFGSE